MADGGASLILLAVAATATVAAGAVGAVDAIKTAKHRNAELEANAQAADINSSIAAANAALEARRRDRELRDSRRKFNLLQGETRAQSGALGIFGGSTLDVLADIHTQGIFEQDSIVDERTMAQQGNLNQSAAERTRASGMRAAKQGGGLKALGIMLGAIGGAAGMMAGGLGSPSGGGGGDVGSAQGGMSDIDFQNATGGDLIA